ncbi:hypothetical protein [Nitrosomonas sp.]|uniref:hypothetical protein n=1 Tax=Nitrosomonas sp. TaxID=42353 RepID=UPI00374CC833
MLLRHESDAARFRGDVYANFPRGSVHGFNAEVMYLDHIFQVHNQTCSLIGHGRQQMVN